jgi:hypothetical protein
LPTIAPKESNEALKLGENEIVLGLGALVAARAHNLLNLTTGFRLQSRGLFADDTDDGGGFKE